MMRENSFLKYFMLAAGAAEIGFALWAFYYHYMCMDHVEHIHAAWLVWQGQVPYRDFFEHHNPLFWYVLAPFVAAFYKNALVLYAARVVSLGFYIFMFAGFYKLCREFLAVSKTVFGLALLLYFLVYDNYYLLFELQPDAAMWGCFFWGLVYYFRFIGAEAEGKGSDIRKAYLLFMASFLFLQKILMLLAILGGYTLYLMRRRRINCRAAWQELAWPAAVAAAFLFWLHYTNSWDLYFIYNYDLNYWMQEFMGDARILQNWLVVGALPLAAILSLHRFLDSRNLYRELLAGLMFLEFIGKMAVGAPYVQYFIFSNLVSALIAADYAVGQIRLKRVKLLLLAGAAAGIVLLWRYPPNTQFPRYYLVQDYITKNSRDNEPIINTVYFFFNLYGRNPSYYWFGYGNVAQAAYYLYGVDEKFDLNRAVRENMPKFVYAVEYINLMGASNKDDLPAYRENLQKIWEKLPEKKESRSDFVKRWTTVSFGRPDYNFLKVHYMLTPYPPLLVRRDLAGGAGMQPAGSKGVLPTSRAEFRVKE